MGRYFEINSAGENTAFSLSSWDKEATTYYYMLINRGHPMTASAAIFNELLQLNEMIQSSLPEVVLYFYECVAPQLFC